MRISVQTTKAGAYAAISVIAFHIIMAALPASAAVPTLEDYQRETEVRAVAMSPDGKKLAVIKRVAEKTYRLFVMDLDNQSAVLAVIEEPEERSITNVRWLNNERMGVTLRGKTHAYGRKIRYDRMAVFDAAGTNSIPVLADRPELNNNFDLANTASLLADDPEHMLLLGYHGGVNVYKVNIYTGTSQFITKGTDRTYQYKVNGKGEPYLRFDHYSRSRKVVILSYDKAKDRWKKITEIRLGDEEDSIKKQTASFDGKESILMVDRKEGDEFSKLHRFDIKTNEFTDVAYEVDEFDVEDVLVDDFSDEVIGVKYISDRPQYVYFEEDVQRIQALLEGQLNSGKVKIKSISKDRNRFLFFATEPWHPGSYFLYDDTEKAIKRIADIAPQIRSQVTTSVDTIRYGSLDGKLIDAYLTFPAESTGMNMPLIVYPHGGPRARNWLGYDLNVQYWATRGYAVFQPNFRGSSGYGKSFQEAGNQEYGGLMIDDIAAGVRALIKAGRVDPDRICSVGISYGGYASLMLDIKTDLMKCIVSTNGPVDYELRIKRELKKKKNKQDREKIRILRHEITGNPETQSDLLASHSPLQRVAEIKSPLLLIHASDDENVEFIHAKKMNKALKRAGKDFEFLKLKEGGHSLHWGGAREIVLKKTEAFFAKHLGTDTPPITPLGTPED